MAGDATIQAAIQTLIRALANFADADVTLGDFQVLGRGSDPYAIVVAGPFEALRSGDYGQVTYAWTHYVEVWSRFTGDSLSGLVTARQAVVDQINKYPTLNSTANITNSWASASDELMYLWQKGERTSALPSFAGFRVTVSTVEEIGYAGSGEFA